MPKKRGKLIIIEGTDGVGKSTQTKILTDRLKKNKIPFTVFHFPNYKTKYGKTIKKCLDGRLGTLKDIDPYYFAHLYAEDRKLSKPKIEKALEKGKIVICDRYVVSNLYHAAKFKTKQEQKDYIKWLYNLEYKKIGLPKEDLLLYLYAPMNLVKRQLIARNKKQKIKSDINESNLKFLNKVQKIILSQILISLRWKKINCSKNSNMLSKKQIADMVYSHIEKLLK